MDIRIEQECPQCGAPFALNEADRVLSCPYCGVRSFLQASGVFRYLLPARYAEPRQLPLLHVPYLRFRGTVYLVHDRGITHKVLDATRLGFELAGLPPTLGIRPQAMQVKRVLPEIAGRYLRLTRKAGVLLERAVRLTPLRVEERRHRRTDLEKNRISVGTTVEVIDHAEHGNFLHRAFIGETVSFVYLPVTLLDGDVVDGVTGNRLLTADRATGRPLRGAPFNRRWQVDFMATLCPHCGWDLDGEGDCLVMTCSNCDTAWALGKDSLELVPWQLVAGDRQTGLYLGFWKVTTAIPALELRSFADFILRTNQPLVARAEWHNRKMSYWIPAFKLRPKVFLRTARGITTGQWRLDPKPGKVRPDMYPVTLPAEEARQAVRVTLAASTANRKAVFPFLPKARLEDTSLTLVFLPFTDKGHDWYQPHTGLAIAKSILRYGRAL